MKDIEAFRAMFGGGVIMANLIIAGTHVLNLPFMAKICISGLMLIFLIGFAVLSWKIK